MDEFEIPSRCVVDANGHRVLFLLLILGELRLGVTVY